MSHVKLFELKSCVTFYFGKSLQRRRLKQTKYCLTAELLDLYFNYIKHKTGEKKLCNENLLVSAGEASHTVRQFEMIENYDEIYSSTYLFLDEDEMMKQ